MPARSALFLSLTLLLSSGCLATRNGRPEERSYQNRETRDRRPETAAAVRWRQIIVGNPPKETLRGYMKTELIAGAPEETRHQYWVYDEDFQLIGRISPLGLTFRMDPFGREQGLGHFHVKHGVLSILGFFDEVAIKLVRMPAPA